MKGRLVVVVVAVAFLFAGILFVIPGLPESMTTDASHQAPESVATSLPASLERLYPPIAPRPALLIAMHELNEALTGIVVDITEGDREGAVTNLRSFQERYRENALLVPEWESRYPAEPVEELAKVVPGGNPEEVMAATARVGAVCHGCHLATMVPVQWKYHWPDFGTITVHDPVVNADVDYPTFMLMLNASMTGVAVNLKQGQPENARAQLAAFRSRMEELRGSCDACHDTERSYFVDQRIESLMEEMGRAIDAPRPDLMAVAALSQRIGEESCFRCHLVHLPAAYSRATSH